MPRPSGTQTRTFNYTGAYLTSATNPETGTVTYSYANGLLMSKTDAKGQQIQYTYDTYNRVTQVRHYPVSGGTEDTCQQVNFAYDSNSVSGFSYLAGRLATRSYSTCAVPFSNTGSALRTDFVDMYSYTQGGLVAVKRLRVKRGTGQYDLDGSWTYDGEGKMTGVTYPTASSGPAGGSYTIGYNSMGQLNTLTDGSVNILTGQTIYIVSGATYGVAGELRQIQGLYNESRGYSPERLQLTSLNGVTFSYPSNSNNNSKISSQYDPSSGETISYAYDQLNRLISAASSQGWKQGFTYDGFGNLTGKTALVGSVPTFSAAFDPATNRQIGISYDANGNQVTDKAGANLLQYDVENRLVWARNGNSSPGDWYGYDPDNRRVYLSNWTYSSSNATWNVTGEQVVYYGVGGQKMGTYALFASSSSVTLTATGYNVYFGSKLIRKIDSMGTVTQVSLDRLGSLGKFYPYGEDRPSNPSANNTEKFATYYRDQDTGFDYAMNRYYNSTSGRFLTPDPYSASGGPGDPGSWNRYGYSRGEPIGRFDPGGLADFSVDAYCWGCSAQPQTSDIGSELAASGLGGSDTVVPAHADVALMDGSTGEHEAPLTGGNLFDLWLEAMTTTSLDSLSEDCQNKLAKAGIDLGKVKAAAAATTYWNASGAEGTLSVQSITGAPGGTMTLSAYLGSSRAATLPGRDNVTPTNNVVLGSTFFYAMNGGLDLIMSQALTLVHEALHYGTGWNDSTVAEKLGAKTPGLSASQNITQWLIDNKCLGGGA